MSSPRLVSCICLLQVHLLFLTTANEPPSGKVINGTFARIVDFPHQAFIVVMKAAKVGGAPARIEGYACGVLIHSHWLLTAAHVMVGSAKFAGGSPVYKIRLGIDDLTQSGVVADVELYRCHPRYKNNDMHDICLLKTRQEIRFSKEVRIVGLPGKGEEDFYRKRDVVKFSGFGETLHPDYKFENLRLRAVDVRIFPANSCGPYSEWVSSWSFIYGKRWEEHDIPITAPHGISGAGDSGSGLVARKSSGRLFLLGILSHSFHHRDKQGNRQVRPSIDVYIKVSHFVDWIFENIR